MTTEPPARGERRSSGSSILRQELGYFLQVLGISAFAVAQPVLDVMGQSPETFIFRGVDRVGIVVFAVAVSVVPAVALLALGAATRPLGPGIRRGVHLATLGAMTSVIAMQVMKKTTPLGDVALVAVAVLAGGALLWLIARVRGVAAWTRWAAVAPVAFLLIFLLVSPVSGLLVAPAAGAAARHAAPVPVVMVVFDELPLVSLIDRSGEINATLYPNFADLASRSTWYRNYTVTERHTLQSIPTMLTGNSVTDRSKRPLAADYPNTLFSLLAETHRLEAFEPVTALCPAAECSRSPEGEGDGQPDYQGLAALLSDAVLVWTDLSLPGRSTRDITAQFAEVVDEPAPGEGTGHDSPDAAGGAPLDAAFLESLTPGPPTLHYFHSLLPHGPWTRFADGTRYQVLEGREDEPRGARDRWRPWLEEEWPVQLVRQRHLLQVQYTDHLLGTVLERLREVEMFDDALVIVTADHGVSLQPGRHRRVPTQENMHEIYWVPLFVKAPQQREGVVDGRNLLAVDLLPTIGAVLEAEVPWSTEGRSALDPDFDRGPTKRILRPSDERTPLPEKVLTIRQRTAQRRMRLEAFAPSGDCRPIRRCPFLVGPGAPFIGDPVEPSAIGPPSDLTATLLLPHGLRPDQDGALPALVLGKLAGVAEGYEGRIAVAMNGSIAGVSEVWTQDDEPGWFGVLSPEFLLRPGDNDLRLFEVEGSIHRPITVAP